MQETFLHYIWQLQYYNLIHLSTEQGEKLQILQPGMLNTDAGPDFTQARVKIGELEWVGQVEIHIKSSDWYQHRHHQNTAYDRVILHVVWQHDKDVYRQDKSLIPTLALDGKVFPELLDKYLQLTAVTASIPCATQFSAVQEVYKIQALHKALMQRLQQKAEKVKELLQYNKNDWEETTYQLLVQNFGFKLNNEPFLLLAKSVPLKLLYKHRDNRLQIEALLFGQAGFLEQSQDEPYYKHLQKEYAFLAHKYQLSSGKLPSDVWKFLRLRPANFPTLRIAHIAALMEKYTNIFSLFLHIESVQEFTELIQVVPSAYWQSHYMFGKTAATATTLGKESKENMLINTVVPLMVCYAQEKGNYHYIEKAISLLEKLPAENNQITRRWKALKMPVENAFDAQGAIQLYNQFCMQKKCLSCPVGHSLLKPVAKRRTC